MGAPVAKVWIVFGDDACGYGLVEFDTLVRHGIADIALVGNDAVWTKIVSEPITKLGDAVGAALARSVSHQLAAGFGTEGNLVQCYEDVPTALRRAREAARAARPVLVKVWRAATESREGSISM